MTQTPGHILTYSGDLFDVANPKPDDIRVDVIAHALGKECRFGGHSKLFYSVAQHSVYASCMVPDELAFAALFHDATEAYLRDIPRPVKALLPDYKRLESKIARVIERAFGLKPRIFQHPKIKQVDSLLQAMEGREIMNNPQAVYDWCGGAPDMTIYEAVDNTFVPMLPADATDMFLARFECLRWAPR